MTSSMKRKIAVVLADRANYGRLKPVLKNLKESDQIQLMLICAGSMLLNRFGSAVDIVRADGFDIDEEVYIEVEGSHLVTMTKSIGLGIIEFTQVFSRLMPDFVLIIGDRYEVLSVAISAVYQNICLIHIQGGEVSGSIDELTRHAITKLSHYHFPATKRAGEHILAMGEDPKTVFPFGCPSADVVANVTKGPSSDLFDSLGIGKHIDFSKRFILVVFHPVTTESGDSKEQIESLLNAVKETQEQAIVLWPNIDAFSDKISRVIRGFRERNKDYPLHLYKNFPPDVFIAVLAKTACAVGNSSSFVRDASFVGTPVVLVGTRQDGRERCGSVIRVESKREDIFAAIKKQLSNGRYKCSNLYGEPGVSNKIVETITTLKPYTQKRLFIADNAI
jgi:UDP-hydrolysing UDP-N-acetyl-D-glucosamine 2-epimerase